MQKILILGGSHRDIPLIKASQALGYFVITLANRDDYLGHQYADDFFKIDFNNLEKIKEVIHQEEIDYLIPGSGEQSYINCITLANELKIGNFDHVKTAKLLHNKWKFKEFCIKNDISTPKGFSYTHKKNIETLQFPVVVKPTNLSGGRGVTTVQNLSELHQALAETKKLSNEIFLEEYIEGKLIAYSIFLKNQEIAYEFLGKDDTYLNPYLITTAYPTTIENCALQKLRNDIKKIAQTLSLVDGMFHLQVIIKNKVPYIIDITRRIPGDFFPDLIELSDTISYSKAVVKSYIGKPISNEFESHEKQKNIVRHCVMPSQNGIYTSLDIDPNIEKFVISRFDLTKEGTIINDYLHTQIAIILLDFSKMKNNLINNLNSLIYPKIKTKREKL